MNKYDLLLWWRKVLMSCETEDQFKNALNLWVNVSKLTPCIGDAWNEVVDAAKIKLNRLVPPLGTTEYIGWRPAIGVNYPETNSKAIMCVFGGLMPICKPPRNRSDPPKYQMIVGRALSKETIVSTRYKSPKR